MAMCLPVSLSIIHQTAAMTDTVNSSRLIDYSGNSNANIEDARLA